MLHRGFGCVPRENANVIMLIIPAFQVLGVYSPESVSRLRFPLARLFWFFFTFRGGSRLLGSRARSFGRSGVGERFLGPRGYANMTLRFLFLHNIFSRYEKPVTRFQIFSRHADPELEKVVLEVCGGPPHDPRALFWESQAPSGPRDSVPRVFLAEAMQNFGIYP